MAYGDVWISNTNLFNCWASPSPATKGTAEGFKGSLHELVPNLQKLSEKDLEKLIEADETDATDDE
jgi:hypothetical protein